MSVLRRRLTGAQDEDGFALIFVMLVTTLVMIGTATMLTVAVGNIGPAKHSQDTYAAQSAAQAGVQDYVARLNARCTTYSIRLCQWLSTSPVVTGTLGTETWTVRAQNVGTYLSNDAALRVTSTGTAGDATRTVTADISGKPTVLRYSYFSNYETVGKTFLDTYFGDRTLSISGEAARAVGLPSGSLVHWYGTAQAPTDAYTDDVCNALYYANNSNPATVAQGRAAAKLARSGLPAGTDFAEDGYTRTPAQQALSVVLPTAKTAVTRLAPCEVTFSNGMSFNGPVYSRDALYLSNGEWGSTTGPSFTVPSAEVLPAASTAWSATSSPTFSSSTAPYRSMAQLGGVPTTANGSTKQLVNTSVFALSLPADTSDAIATCAYTGPTRVTLKDDIATVTSPQTAPGSSPCYTANASGAGVVAQVRVGVTTIKVNAGGSGTRTPSFPDLALGANGDVTAYSPTAGDIYVEGQLTSGKLSLVAANDIVVTGSVTTSTAAAPDSTPDPGTQEPTWKSGGAIDLVATNNVRVYHPVACKTGSATDGYCPNDITGLYASAQAGTVVNDGSNGTQAGSLKLVHPSLQYCNLPATDCGAENNSSTPSLRIDAAIFALNGSFLTDNYNRGRGLGGLVVNGGVYQCHRGPTGQLWEIPTATSVRRNAGYKLRINYLGYQTAGLPYVPVLNGGDPSSPWQVIGTSTGGS